MRPMKNIAMGLAACIAGPLAFAVPPSARAAAAAAAAAATTGLPTAAATAGATANSKPALDAKDIEAWLDGFLPYALEKGRIAGAVVTIVRSSGPILEKGYGFSDVANRKPVSADSTLFRPGSVSKLLTWTAVMQMVEAGKIDLDQDVNAYLDFKIPAYKGKPITMRHILTHMTGFQESVRYLITSNPKALRSLETLIPTAIPTRVFEPGTTPAYSNYATALAGYIVARVSGLSFDDYIDQRIFKPLGMTRSSFRQPLPAALEPMMSLGYPDSTQKPKPYELVHQAPAGSLAATGSDMSRFMIAHLNKGAGLMKPETAALMHNSKGPALGPLNAMALGFYERHVNGRRAITHGGDTTLFHSYLWLFPQDDVGVYISMNSNGVEGAAGAIRNALFHKFADRYLPGDNAPVKGIDEKTAREHAQLIAGKYSSSRGSFTNFLALFGLLSQVDIAVTEAGKLSIPMLDAFGASQREWVETEPFVWRDLNTGERLAAEIVDGKVARIGFDPASAIMVLKPVPATQNSGWLIPATIASLALALIAFLGWPLRALIRRYYGKPMPFARTSRLAFRLSRVFAGLTLVSAACWVALISAFSADIGALGGPTDMLLLVGRILSPLSALGLIASAGWLLALNFVEKRGWVSTLGALLLTLAGLTLFWVVLVAKLYGFGMVY